MASEQKPLTLAVGLAKQLVVLISHWEEEARRRRHFTYDKDKIAQFAAILDPVLGPLMECRETLLCILDLLDQIKSGLDSINSPLLILGGACNMGREQLEGTQHLEHGEGGGDVED